DLAGREGKLLDRDQRDDRRGLDEADELAGERRQDAPEGLRQDDEAQKLPGREAETASCLPLALLDRLDAGAHDLGDVGALEEGQAQEAGDEVDEELGVAAEQGQNGEGRR